MLVPCLAPPAPARAQEVDHSPALLTRVEQVRALPTAEAAKGLPVRLDGVVTLFDPASSLLFVQDETGGLYVERPRSTTAPIRFGQRVDVQGRTAPGDYSPIVAAPRIRVLAEGRPAPAPRQCTASELASGAHECQWVEVRGVVQSAAEAGGRLSISLGTDEGSLQAVVVNYPRNLNPARALVDARVRLKGVCVLQAGAGRQIQKVTVWAPRFEELQIEAPPGSSDGSPPLRPVSDLLGSATSPAGLHRVRVRGNLVAKSEQGLVLEADGHSVKVEGQGWIDVRPGDRLEVVGFLERREDTVVLGHATARLMAPGRGRGSGEETPDPAGWLPVLTQSAEVRALSPEEAADGYPVRLQGVVTYSDPDASLLFVQDHTAGLYIAPGVTNLHLRPGQLVEVEGFTDPGDFAPIVADARIRPLGERSLPTPQVASLDMLLTGHYDSQFVEARGVVRALTGEGPIRVLDVLISNAPLEVVVPSELLPPNADQLVDSRVRLVGVCATRFNAHRQLLNVRLLIPTRKGLEILNPPPADPFAGPVRSLQSLNQFNAANAPEHRIRVQGVVTFHQPDLGLFLADGTGSARVQASAPGSLAPGDRVDAAGFVTTSGMSPMLQQAQIRVLGRDTVPEAVRIEAREGLTGERDAQRVEVEARLLTVVRRPGHHLLSLEAGDVVFEARLPESAGAKAGEGPGLPGTRLRLAGICRTEVNESGEPRGFQLLLQSGADIEVLERPSRWTAQHLLRGLAGAGVVLSAALAWVVLLRRRVRNQTEVIRRRLEAEAALERRYQLVWELAADGMRLVDGQGLVVRVNAAYCHMVELKREDLEGRPFCTAYDESEPDEVLRLFRERFQNRSTASSFERPLRLWNGRERWFQVSNSFYEVPGQTALLLSSFRDVTDRKQAEAALQASEAEYRALFNTMLNGFSLHEVLCDTEGHPEDYRYLSVNAAFERQTGLRASELIGRTIREVMPQIEPIWIERFGRVALTGVPAHFEHYVTGLDQHFEVYAYSPRPGQFAVVSVDITARRLAEEALRQSAEQYRALFESANDAIVILDPESEEILAANTRACELYGFPREELIGRSMKQLTKDVARGEAQLREVLQTGLFKDFETVHFNQSGQPIEILLNSSVIEFQGRKAVLSINRDITERKRLEERLRQAQKMEGIGTLAGGVAHDFNNMLTAILGNAHLALADPGLSGDSRECLRQITESAQRAAGLTRQLLTFSRKHPLQKKRLNLNEIVAQLFEMLRRIIGEDINLGCEYAPEVPAIFADQSMVEQVLLNLAVNARDAMPGGGRLTLRTRLVEIGATPARSAAGARAGRFVSLEVEDTGSGIAPEVLPRIFDPFFTTKDVGKGTGLGLATVYGILEQHQGWIEVDSTVGHGTRFSAFFPLCPAAQPEAPAPASPAPRAGGGRECILVVEDEAPLRRSLVIWLGRFGYRVIEATNGHEALAQWEKHQGEIDLLMTDLVMPGGVSGQQLARQLREARADLKVLYTSGYSLEGTNTTQLERGIGYLAKPYEPNKLAEALQHCLRPT